MFLTIVDIVLAFAALVAGAAWGAYGTLPAELGGFIVALANGASMVSAPITTPPTLVVSIWISGPTAVAAASIPWWW